MPTQHPGKRPHLPRPKQHNSFLLTPTATPLEKIAHLLRHITIRNKNQHRSTAWFKQLNYLRRGVKQLISYDDALLRLPGDQPGSTTNLTGPHSASSSGTLKAEDVRKKFEREAELRRLKEVTEGWMREVVVPNCWVEFSRVVGDKQFVGLGMVLVGVLADVAAVVGLPTALRNGDGRRGPGKERIVGMGGAGGEGENWGVGKGKVKSVVARSLRVTGDERGEVVERVFDSGEDDVGEVIERSCTSGGKGERGSGDTGEAFDRDTMDLDPGQDTTRERMEPAEQQGSEERIGAVEDAQHARGVNTKLQPANKSVRKDENKPVARKKKKKNAIDEIFGDW